MSILIYLRSFLNKAPVQLVTGLAKIQILFIQQVENIYIAW